jgi:L-iditol 2-dehydrogenase
MRVGYFTGLREIEIRDEPEPQLTRADDALLRIDRVGVCGSDVHYYTHGRIGNQIVRYPATIGHECSGTVVAVGRSVDRLRAGDRVAVDPAVVCGQCDQCLAGRSNTCRNIQFLGCPDQAPGAVADYRVLPAENCVPIPDRMTLEQAVLVEPLSIGVYAVRAGGVRSGSRVAILGAGPIGLSVLLAAKAAAPSTAYATDLLDERLAAARRCGADWTGNPRAQDIVAEIGRREPRGVDLVFECSGDPECIDQGMKLLAPGGTLLWIGIPPVVQVRFDAHRMRTKEITFKAVRRQQGCVEPAIRLIGEGQIDTAPLLTHRFPLDRIRDAFELVATYQDGVIKAVLDLS